MSDPMSRPVDPMSRGAMAGGDHVAGGGDGVSLSSLWVRWEGLAILLLFETRFHILTV